MFRSLGLKSTGKHAAPKGYVPKSRPGADTAHAHRPAHAPTEPRLTGSPDSRTADSERRAA